MKRGIISRAALILIEHSGNKLSPATFHTLAAVKQLNTPIHAMVVGTDCDAVIESVSKLGGIEKVLFYSSKEQLAEKYSDIIQDAQSTNKYTHIVTNHTSFGKNILPRLASVYDVQPITDILSVKGSNQFVRPIYAGNALTLVESTNTVHLLTIRSTAFEKSIEESTPVPVEKKSISTTTSFPIFKGQQVVKNERPELTSARIVISGGRGLKSEENFKKLYSLADKMGAAVGASRAAVDAGYAPNDLQIGQTGKVVAPDLYIAFGISGAIQHLAGMKDSKCIVSINKDKEAPIFQVSDIGLVADLFDVIPEMESKVVL